MAKSVQYFIQERLIKLGWRPHVPPIGPWDGYSIEDNFGEEQNDFKPEVRAAMLDLYVRGCPFSRSDPEYVAELRQARTDEEAYQKRREKAHRGSSGCHATGCDERGAHFHHVTYRPTAGFKLCVKHHKDITVCNINAANKIRRKLSNKHRWFIWSQWLKGAIEPVYDANALRYLATWRD